MPEYSELREKEIARLKEAIEEIKRALYKPKQTLPEARHEIALILQRLKDEA